jgi:hypothetical protein
VLGENSIVQQLVDLCPSFSFSLPDKATQDPSHIMATPLALKDEYSNE